MMQIVSTFKVRITTLLVAHLHNRQLIEEERDGYLKCKSIHLTNLKNIDRFGTLLREKNTPYINHLLYRVRENKGLYPMIVHKILEFLWEPMNTLFFHTPVIGKGLIINHGFATIITAAEIGDCCLIGQQVTIGVKEPGGGTFYRR